MGYQIEGHQLEFQLELLKTAGKVDLRIAARHQMETHIRLQQLSLLQQNQHDFDLLTQYYG